MPSTLGSLSEDAAYPYKSSRLIRTANVSGCELSRPPNMLRYLPVVAATAALFQQGNAQQYQNGTTESVKLHWISGSAPSYTSGTTFGLPWARGKHFPNSTVFDLSDSESDLQSWVTAYWNDGSIKWTGHAVPAADVRDRKSVV